MSGSAPAGGFDFQSNAFAFVAAHTLAAQPLDWFDGLTAVPIAISMETGGPGDDLRIELSDGRCIELQAKKGLSRGKDFNDAMSALARGLIADRKLFGVLLVDLAASAPIRETLRQDILRISDGRDDLLKSETEELLAMLDTSGIGDRSVFQRLRIIVKDFAPTGDGRAAAISLLRPVVADPMSAVDAWSILSDEGLALCARRGRRDTEALGLLLHLRSDAEVRLLAKHHYREWVKTTNADFFVPALNLRLPVAVAWNQLRWLEAKMQSGDPEQTSLAGELKRYHEWARLADDSRGERGAIADLLHAERRLVIIGGPGSGKSTLLRLIAYEAAVAGKIVLRVSLQLVRQFMVGGRSFEEAVAAAASQGSPLDQEAIQSCLAEADLLLADGLDETEPQRLSVAGAIADWALAHPQTQVCVTTRPIGHQPHLLRTFREAEILPLPRHLSGDLAAKLLRAAGYSPESSEELAKPFYNRRHSRDEALHAATMAMRNPLLLTFLVRLHIDGQPLDGRRAALYSRIIELIRRTSPTDRVGAEDPGARVTRVGLAVFAWKLQSAPGCPREEALGFVATELSTASHIPPIESARLSEEIESFWENRRLLERVQSGSQETITFVHLSLAEYAAAEYLRNMSDSALTQWLSRHRRETAWHDTIALASGAGALERIVPLLLELDEPDNPCSDEVMLSAASLAEAEQPPQALAAEVIRRLVHRLDSKIPLLSIEAAQRLAAIAPVMRHLVEEVCCPRLNHSQNWTRLGAHAVLLATASDTLAADQVRAWLNDPTQSPANASRRDALPELPDTARSLRRAALTRAFEVVFRQLPRDEARSVAESFLGNTGVTVGELEAIARVLEANQCSDLAEQRWGGKGMPNLSDFDLRDNFAIPGFLRLLLAAVDVREAPVRNNSCGRLPNLLNLFAVLDWWEQPVYAVHAISQREEAGPAIEVLRAVINVAEVPKNELAAEVNHLLSLDDAKFAIFCAADLTKRDSDVQWARGANLVVDAAKLVRGFVHPSDVIQIAAAQLVYAGTGGSIAAKELKALLPRVINRALYYVAFAGAKVWGEDAQALLIARFKAEPKEGVEHICQVLATLANRTNNKAEIATLLLEALKHERPAIAHHAAEGLRKLKPDPIPEYCTLLRDAFAHWQQTDLYCRRCGVVCPTGSCPQCHVVQQTPLQPLVNELARTRCFTVGDLLEMTQSPSHQVKEAAVIELVELVRTEHTALATLIEQWSRERASTAVLNKLLLVPSDQLIKIVESLLPLRHSASPNIRASIVAALPALPCNRDHLEQFARDALTDESPAVRNAAAISIRSLRSPNIPTEGA